MLLTVKVMADLSPYHHKETKKKCIVSVQGHNTYNINPRLVHYLIYFIDCVGQDITLKTFSVHSLVSIYTVQTPE